MKATLSACGVVLFCLLSLDLPCGAQQAAEPNKPGAAAQPAPGATPPAEAPARGRGRGGAPLTDAEKAEIATLSELPPRKPGAGDGNYSIGPDYAPCPEMTPREGVPVGKVESFTLNADESKFYPPTGLRGRNPTRKVTVYIPAQYKPGTPAPIIVAQDAYGSNKRQLPNILDNMIHDKRLPAIIAIMIANGGGDGGGSQRGHEYDTVSGTYAEFVEAEVLPRVEKEYGVTLTKDPDARMTLGGSSGAAAAFTMAWFHPELYHRVLSYSGTFTNQQSGEGAPHGAWTYHEKLIPESPVKPLRVWLHVSDRDNGAQSSAAGFKNWVIANKRMADVLKAKDYHYQFVFSKNSGHTDGKVIAQTYPQALEWVWQGYKAK